jgi:hypothetical protein
MPGSPYTPEAAPNSGQGFPLRPFKLLAARFVVLLASANGGDLETCPKRLRSQLNFSYFCGIIYRGAG